MKYRRIPTAVLVSRYVADRQSLRQIGRAVGMDPSSVRYRLLRAGIVLRGRGQYERPESSVRRASELAWMEL